MLALSSVKSRYTLLLQCIFHLVLCNMAREKRESRAQNGERWQRLSRERAGIGCTGSNARGVLTGGAPRCSEVQNHPKNKKPLHNPIPIFFSKIKKRSHGIDSDCNTTSGKP